MAAVGDEKNETVAVMGEPHYRFCCHFQRNRLDEHPVRIDAGATPGRL